MTYRNNVTGAVLTVDDSITLGGDDWEAVEDLSEEEESEGLPEEEESEGLPKKEKAAAPAPKKPRSTKK